MFKVPETGKGIVRENANFRGSETDSPRREKKIHGEKKSAVQKRKKKKMNKKGNKMKKNHRF